jgi:hypothetical protein
LSITNFGNSGDFDHLPPPLVSHRIAGDQAIPDWRGFEPFLLIPIHVPSVYIRGKVPPFPRSTDHARSPDHGDLPVIPLPWCPTAFQAIPEWRGLQPSSPIPDPRSSASIRGKLWFFRSPAIPAMSAMSAIGALRATLPYPSIRIPKHLPRIIPRASQAAADWPKPG